MKVLSTTTVLIATLLGFAIGQPYYNSTSNNSISANFSINLKTASPTYTLTYTVDSRYTPAVVNYQLNLQSFDVSSWGVNGTGGYGMYLGLGLGSTDMDDAHLVLCRYQFTNAKTDAFYCNDATSTHNVVSNSTSNNLYNVTTVYPVNYVRTASSAAA
jgi:hypothetical protein